jgi:hypothetical protein
MRREGVSTSLIEDVLKINRILLVFVMVRGYGSRKGKRLF